jgi:hypothetical protein
MSKELLRAGCILLAGLLLAYIGLRFNYYVCHSNGGAEDNWCHRTLRFVVLGVAAGLVAVSAWMLSPLVDSLTTDKLKRVVGAGVIIGGLVGLGYDNALCEFLTACNSTDPKVVFFVSASATLSTLLGAPKLLPKAFG